jgi:chorismate synthase
MGSFFGNYFSIATFGESHGPAVGVVIDGIPFGVNVDASGIQMELDRRRPGKSAIVSARQELDQVEILSGIVNGQTLGTPIALLVRNRDARPEDYKETIHMFRPGHADFTYFRKYGLPPQPGGGRASGRETVGRVAAGAVAKAFLGVHGIKFRSYTVQIGNIQAKKIDLDYAEKHPLRCPDPDLAVDMTELVRQAQAEGDSVGGVVELVAEDVPPGLGSPVFDKLDALLGWAMLSIGGVKGVEFGGGFALTGMRGSQTNDQITSGGFLSNHSGGILGGISTGQPIVLRIAVKPTSSIALPQRTIDVKGKERTIRVKGRHDPCLCPRIAPVAEAMAAIVLTDAMLEHTAISSSMPKK